MVIQHPGGKVERLYWSITASRVMADNPGHYVAVIITAPASSGDNNTSANSNAGIKHHGRRRGSGNDGSAPVKHLKLLRPDDTLLMGHVYRLVSFEGFDFFLLKKYTLPLIFRHTHILSIYLSLTKKTLKNISM